MPWEVLCFLRLTFLREIIRNFQDVCKDFSDAFQPSCARFQSRGTPRKAVLYGEENEDHDQNRFFVNSPGPKFDPRMVSAMRGRGGNDRAGKRRRDFELGAAGIGGMAQFAGAASVAGCRRLSADLPEFTAGSRTENKNQLTAASRGCEIHKETI